MNQETNQQIEKDFTKFLTKAFKECECRDDLVFLYYLLGNCSHVLLEKINVAEGLFNENRSGLPKYYFNKYNCLYKEYYKEVKSQDQ